MNPKVKKKYKKKKIVDDKRRTERGYNAWTKAVKKKYNFVCQICYSESKPVVAHHIESYKENEKLRTDINNGTCLCVDCHDDYHSFYGIASSRTYSVFKKIVQGKKHDIPVIKINKVTGKPISVYNSISEATRDTDIKYACILWCCLGKKSVAHFGKKKLTAGEFVWKYKNHAISAKSILEELLNSEWWSIEIYDFTRERAKVIRAETQRKIYELINKKIDFSQTEIAKFNSLRLIPNDIFPTPKSYHKELKEPLTQEQWKYNYSLYTNFNTVDDFKNWAHIAKLAMENQLNPLWQHDKKCDMCFDFPKLKKSKRQLECYPQWEFNDKEGKAFFKKFTSMCFFCRQVLFSNLYDKQDRLRTINNLSEEEENRFYKYLRQSRRELKTEKWQVDIS